MLSGRNTERKPWPIHFTGNSDDMPSIHAGSAVIACTLLGIAASSLAKSGRSAGVVLNVPSVALQFLSGIFVQPITALPVWMLGISSLFPVKWMGQGFRSVFLPDTMAAREAAGAWEHGTTALVLAAWCVGGLVLSMMTFRWSNTE